MYTAVQQKDIITRYVKEMEIIKLRSQSISTAFSQIGFLEPAVEYQALQLRKIIEQIVLGSLIVNSDIYLEYYNRLGRDWNIKYICRDIKQLHADYFPIAATDQHDEHVINDNPEISLTENDVLEMHERMGKLLHSHNPFASEIDYRVEADYIKECLERIVRYLSVHTIKLYGGNDFLFVVMSSTNSNGRVSVNWFTKVDE